MRKMKAVYLVGKKKVEIFNIPVPEIEKGDDVLIKIKCVGVCGSDIHYFTEGKIGDQVVEDKIILGHECAGEVVEVGKNVKNLKSGDKVAVEPGISCGRCEFCVKGKPNLCPYVKFLGTPPVDGALREYLVMPEKNLVKIPEGLGFDEGVLSEPLAIGLYGVKLSKLEVGDDVAVLGTGPIGLSAVFSLREGGAKKIFATDLIKERLDFAKKIGADAVFNPEETNIVRKIKEMTDGKGVDIVYEAAGQSETIKQAEEIVKIGGKIVIYGIPSDDRIEFTAHSIRRKEITVINVRRACHTTLLSLQMVQKSSLPFKEMVTHRFPIEKAEEALNLVADYKDGVIKAMIDI